MVAELERYLDTVRHNLRLGPRAEREVITELEAHIEDRLEELRGVGLSEDEATGNCLRLLGSAKKIARQFYEARSQGTWRQALMASMPHLLFALVFTLDWWQSGLWPLAVLAFVLLTAIYGWWHGRPTWLFPWMGYLLLPVVGAGLLLLYLPREWSWLAILVYVPLALRLVYTVIVHALKRDWLNSTLMLFPVPVIVGWFLVVFLGDRLSIISLERLRHLAPWIGLSLAALAASVGAFVRLRQRWLRVIVLFVSGSGTLVAVAFYAGGWLSLPLFLALFLAFFGFFLAPALVERRLRRPGH